MDIELIIYFGFVAILSFSYLIAGITRIIGKNEDSFKVRNMNFLNIKAEDNFAYNKYRTFYILFNITISILYIALIVISYVSIKDNLIDVTERTFELIAIYGNAAIIIYLFRTTTFGLIGNMFVKRVDQSKRSQASMAYFILLIGFIVTFVYRIITY